MTHHYFTRSPSIAAELQARGMFPATYLTHADLLAGVPDFPYVNISAVHEHALALRDRGDKNGLFLANIEWQNRSGPVWCDPDPNRTYDFRLIENTAQVFRDVCAAASTYLGCPLTCTEAWLLPTWRYADGEPGWRRNACTLKGLGMMDNASAVYCQCWADDSDQMGIYALDELRRNLRLSDFWGYTGLPRYFQLSPYTKGTPTTPGILHPPEYTREAVRLITQAGHNVVWFLPQLRDGDAGVDSAQVEAASEVGRAVLARISRANAIPSGGGVA